MNTQISAGLRSVGRIFARVSIMVLLILSFFFSSVALHTAAPEASREIASIVVIASVGGVDLTVFDPFILAVVAWSIAPATSLVRDLWQRIQVMRE